MGLFLVVAGKRLASVLAQLGDTDARAILSCAALLHWGRGLDELRRRVGSATLIAPLDGDWRF